MSDSWIMPKFSPVIKVVSAGCNLACRYCFYDGEQPEIKPMRTKTLRAVLARCLEVAPSVNFIWHGGEPLLTGIDFYKEVLSLQQKLCKTGQKVSNDIQTNGILLNSSWVVFLKEAGFDVGISLDGPERFHNFTRVYPNGTGSFTDVMAGIDAMKTGSLKFGTIAVINRHTLSYPAELFDFMHRLGLSFSINFCAPSVTGSSDETLVINPFEYSRYLLKMFDLWLALDDKRFRIHPLDDLVRGVLGRMPELCRYSGNCQKYLSIDSNGDVYSCDGFLNTDALFGNLLESGFSSIFNSSKFLAYYEGRQPLLEACRSCRWILACKGGCMREWGGLRSIANPKLAEFCQARTFLFEQISERLTKLGYGG